MINNKNQLKKALKENKNNILIKRIYNFDNKNKIKVGDIATIEAVQSNAFMIKYNNIEKPCWIYFDNIDVEDNKIIYYNYIDNFDIEKAEETKKRMEGAEITVIPVTEDDKINKNIQSNYKYIYKFIYIINEIIEK